MLKKINKFNILDRTIGTLSAHVLRQESILKIEAYQNAIFNSAPCSSIAKMPRAVFNSLDDDRFSAQTRKWLTDEASYGLVFAANSMESLNDA